MMSLMPRLPEYYSQVKAPAKLPPLKQATSLQSLPILGYLEQTAAASITTALATVGCFKPRLPFKDASSSALTYVAYHLKGVFGIDHNCMSAHTHTHAHARLYTHMHTQTVKDSENTMRSTNLDSMYMI